jgi:hypothetical protein
MSSNLSLTGLEVYFGHTGTKRICARRLSYTTWTLDNKAPGFGRAAAAELARYYVGLTQAWTNKDAAIRLEPPALHSTSKGDFGELITASLFGRRQVNPTGGAVGTPNGVYPRPALSVPHVHADDCLCHRRRDSASGTPAHTPSRKLVLPCGLTSGQHNIIVAL